MGHVAVGFGHHCLITTWSQHGTPRVRLASRLQVVVTSAIRDYSRAQFPTCRDDSIITTSERTDEPTAVRIVHSRLRQFKHLPPSSTSLPSLSPGELGSWAGDVRGIQTGKSLILSRPGKSGEMHLDSRALHAAPVDLFFFLSPSALYSSIDSQSPNSTHARPRAAQTFVFFFGAETTAAGTTAPPSSSSSTSTSTSSDSSSRVACPWSCAPCTVLPLHPPTPRSKRR